MTHFNPLSAISYILTPRSWIHVQDMVLIVGFQMKLANVDWRVEMDIIKIITELVNCGFLQVNLDDLSKLRLAPSYRYGTTLVPMEKVKIQNGVDYVGN